MTSKEKAKELYLKFHFAIPAIADEGQQGQNSAKECALIAVDEILDNCYEVMKPFWLEVKKEIESL
jgi:hypothetical protein